MARLNMAGKMAHPVSGAKSRLYQIVSAKFCYKGRLPLPVSFGFGILPLLPQEGP